MSLFFRCESAQPVHGSFLSVVMVSRRVLFVFNSPAMKSIAMSNCWPRRHFISVWFRKEYDEKFVFVLIINLPSSFYAPHYHSLLTLFLLLPVLLLLLLLWIIRRTLRTFHIIFSGIRTICKMAHVNDKRYTKHIMLMTIDVIIIFCRVFSKTHWLRDRECYVVVFVCAVENLKR